MWIDSHNFEILKGLKEGQASLSAFADVPEVEEYKVAFNDLTAVQKKELVDIEVDFKLYVSNGKYNPKLKSKVIKEPLFEKSDIISLVKMIIGEKDRDKVLNALLSTDISPVVIQQWAMQSAFVGSDEAWQIVVKAEEWVNNKRAYAYIIASDKMLGARFKFPKKLRK
jgi:hypothetical protein